MRTFKIFAGMAALVAACSAGAGKDAANFGGSSGSGVGPAGGFGGSAASGGGGGIDISGGSAGSAGTSLGDAACAAAAFQGEKAPLDMFVVYDRSGSMAEDAQGGTVWDVVKNAFIQFVQSPQSAGIGMGLMFFPPGAGGWVPCPFMPPCPPGCAPGYGGFGCMPDLGGACDPNNYRPPAVNIQLLPGVSSQIASALNGTGPGGQTPTLPAMQSAADATTAYAKTVPAHKVVMVLQTDGEPNECNSTVAGVAGVAASALAANPSVPTFVIGIGDLQGMDQIAQAGGTNQAIRVDAANPGQAFLEAMNAIRGKAFSCEFQLPDPGAGQTVNPAQVNVRYSPDGTPPGDIVHNVPDAGACDPARGGWYYNATKDRVLLCPASCDRVDQEQGRVDIELGCDTVVAPPR